MKFLNAVKDRLSMLKSGALSTLRYMRHFKKNRPQTKEWLISARDNFVAGALYVRNIRRHWPEIRAGLKRRQEGIYRPMYNKYFAAAAYIPFVGWLAPLYLKPEDELCRNNGRRGFVLAAFFLALSLFLFFLVLIFVPREWRPVRLAIVLLMYIGYLAYFSICAWAAYGLIREKKLEMPWLEKYIRLVELQRPGQAMRL